ncbi:MAG: CopG family transcriptional regulator [Candidatus Sericytochromatia bacterium]|nr:CopG family transcriptional regulator [Candidatus Tanganyikabacteria bacterium]
MRRTNIYLDDDVLVVLKHLAAHKGQGITVSDLVREAIGQYLARQDLRSWSDRLGSHMARVWAKLPSIPPDEIEADVTAARAEARRARRR